MYDLASNNPNPVINYDGVSKNITGLGFQVWYSWSYLEYLSDYIFALLNKKVEYTSNRIKASDVYTNISCK